MRNQLEYPITDQEVIAHMKDHVEIEGMLSEQLPICGSMDTMLAKTAYDFGFNEWCFAEQADRDKFLEFVPSITWGETYED